MKFLLIALLFVSTACTVVRPGESGVVFNKFTGSLHTETPGIVMWLPGRVVEAYPTALRTYTMVKRTEEGSNKNDDSIDLPSREGQHIRQDLSVTYNTSPDRASDVFRSFKGEDIQGIEESFIRRTVITVAQNAAGNMSLTELISTKRDELQETISKRLGEELGKMGFVLDKVNLGAAHLPASVEAQMQAKMAAQQDAQRAEYEVQKQTMLAKAKVAEAEGDAQASILAANAKAKANAILQQSLTPAILERMRIEKWSGNLPQIMGGNATPFININKANN